MGTREERVYGALDEVSLQGLHRDRTAMVARIVEHAQQGRKMRGDASTCQAIQLSCRWNDRRKFTRDTLRSFRILYSEDM